MKFINKIRGKYGWFKSQPYMENGVVQYETVLDTNGDYVKICVCSQFDYDNKLNIYDDVSYLIPVVSNDTEPVFKMLPSYEKWLSNEIKELQNILLNNKEIPEHILEAFQHDRKMRAEIPTTALMNGGKI